MNRIENHLKNDLREEYRNLINIPLSELTGLEDCSTFEELKNNYLIYANPFKIQERNIIELWLIEGNNESRKFKWLSPYTIKASIFFMIIFPLLVSNYWLYLILILIPVAAKASSIFPSPSKLLYWIAIIGLIIYALFSKNFEIYGMITPLLLLKIFPQKSMVLYRDTILNAARSNELNFKYLFYIRMVTLQEKKDLNASRIICK